MTEEFDEKGLQEFQRAFVEFGDAWEERFGPSVACHGLALFAASRAYGSCRVPEVATTMLGEASRVMREKYWGATMPKFKIFISADVECHCPVIEARDRAEAEKKAVDWFLAQMFLTDSPINCYNVWAREEEE